MKNGIIISIFTAIVTYLFVSQEKIQIIFATLLTLIALIYLFLKPKLIFKSYKIKFDNYIDNVTKPFVNVNKVSWKILMLIPNIDKMTAKHIVHNRRHFGKYKNFDDFFNINQISEDYREQIKNYIIL